MSLSEKTKKALKKYGWNPERKVDVNEFIKHLKAEGYVVFDVVVDFIEKFGGLSFQMPSLTVSHYGLFGKGHFDPKIAEDAIFPETLQEYEEVAKEKMIPVGEIENHHYVILLSESGKMYAAMSDFLALVGNNYEEGIERLFNSEEPIAVLQDFPQS